jgi:hypothetical protein
LKTFIFNFSIKPLSRRGGNNIKNKLFLATGYIVGLSCLFLVTYRTLIAFFSESNAVIIYVNEFGEKYIDIFALVIFWIICLVGLTFLIKFLRDEKIIKDNSKKLELRQTIDK